MTNEQLAGFIKQGGADDLKPILWDRVKKLVFMICDRYYTKYSERFVACGVERCDYRQACYEAFLKALEAFDEASGKKFTSFMDYHVRNTGAELLGIHNAKRHNNKPLDNCASLDAPLAGSEEGEEITLGGTIEDVNAQQAFEEAVQSIADEQTRAVLHEALTKLEERERDVIIKEYFEGMTQRRIAELYGVSSERVRQIKNKAMTRLRSNTKLTLLREKQYTERRLHFRSFDYSRAFYEAQTEIKRILKTGHYLSYGRKHAIIYECMQRRERERQREQACSGES